jgi:hypothetical protein
MISYLRSSSIGSFRICPAKWVYAYLCEIPDVSGKSAHQGNAVHKALELGALCQLARQASRPTFTEAETGTVWETAAFDYDRAMDVGYDHYASRSAHIDWKPRDREDCRAWLKQALAIHGGEFNPLNRRVVAAEQFFDLEIPHAWAKYESVDESGRQVFRQLRIKGTIDLLFGMDGEPDAIELCDWKTGGRMWDWAANKEKRYSDFVVDHQLRMYAYSTRRLYPQFKKLYVTINYVRAGGPTTVPFGDEQMAETEEMLRREYEAMKAVQVPARALNHACRFCHYAKENHSESGKPLCEHLHGEITQLGLDKVVAKYAPHGKKEYVGGGRGH